MTPLEQLREAIEKPTQVMERLGGGYHSYRHVAAIDLPTARALLADLEELERRRVADNARQVAEDYQRDHEDNWRGD